LSAQSAVDARRASGESAAAFGAAPASVAALCENQLGSGSSVSARDGSERKWRLINDEPWKRA